jgi:uncharacterized protein
MAGLASKPVQFVFLLVAALASAGSSRPSGRQARGPQANDETEQVKKRAVVRLENEWLEALEDNNVSAIEGILADDFQRPAPQFGQFVGKAELLSFYRSHPRPAGSERKRINDLVVTIYDTTAIARGKVVTTDANGGVVSSVLFTDVLVERDGKWQAVSAQENESGGASGPAAKRSENGNHEMNDIQEQRNIATIIAIFRSIEERDASKNTELFEPDFEIHWPGSLPYGGTFRGIGRRPSDWTATWDRLQPTAAEKKMDARVIATHGDDVVVLWHQKGRSATGDALDAEVLGLYHFREGKLARAQMFYFDTAAVAAFLTKENEP